MEKGESNLYKLLINDDYFKNPKEIATSYVETLGNINEDFKKSKVRNFESYLSRIFNTNSISENEIEFIAIAMHCKDDSKSKEECKQLIRDARDADGRAQFDRRKFSEHQQFLTEVFNKFENLNEAFICTAKPFEVYKNEIGSIFVDKTIKMVCNDNNKKITFCLNDAVIIKKFYENIALAFKKSEYCAKDNENTKDDTKINLERFIENFNNKIDVYLVCGLFTVFPFFVIDYYENKFGFNLYSHSGTTLDFIKISDAGLERWRTEIYNRFEIADTIPFDKNIIKLNEVSTKMKVLYYDFFPNKN